MLAGTSAASGAHLVATLVGLQADSKQVATAALECIGMGRVGEKADFDVVASWYKIEVDVEVLCQAAADGAFVRLAALERADFHADSYVE